MIRIIRGDCLDVLRTLPAESVHAVVTDPPYGLSFMGKRWDYDVPSVEVWAECMRVLKPGGHLLAFAGTRTQHRMAVRIEDAGFEIRDLIAWVYGSGFPKSLDVSKAIDKRGGNANLTAEVGAAIKAARISRGMSVKDADSRYCGGSTLWTWYEGRPAGQQMPTAEVMALIAADWPELQNYAEAIAEADREVVGKVNGSRLAVAPGQGNDRSTTTIDVTAAATEAARQWQGWGTALKPALEPITVARKPLAGTVAENVLTHGTGALNIDGCRVGDEKITTYGPEGGGKYTRKLESGESLKAVPIGEHTGRWPANLIHDGSEEVVALFPEVESGQPAGIKAGGKGNAYGLFSGGIPVTGYGDRGSAARFFYCAKADAGEREMGMELQQKFGGGRSNTHPTVKPVDLMRYLIRLVTPKGGTVLDPFAGSGTTGLAAMAEQADAILIERESQYVEIAAARIRGTAGLFADAELCVEST